MCDGYSNAIQEYPCTYFTPYCVKHGSHYAMCSGNFPMDNQACLTRATNNFICTADGQFPGIFNGNFWRFFFLIFSQTDPTDCTKYHVCNGTAHSMVECPASNQFWFDLDIIDPYYNPGNGEFRCRFRVDNEACTCDRLYCDGLANSFAFFSMDYFHYAYCLEIGTLRKTVMFKCPKGTRHFGQVSSMTNSVDCVAVGAPV